MVRLPRRLILWIGAGVVGLVLLLALGLTLAVLLVDPNRFKGRIEHAVQERTGRELELHGELRWRVFPWLVVQTGAGALGNPAGFAGPGFARWQSARLGVKLLPLLHREVLIDSVQVNGAELDLRRDPQGRVNWQFAAVPSSPAAAMPLQVDAVQLRDATLRFEDARSGATLQASDISLDASLPPGTTTQHLRIEKLRFTAQLRSSALGAAPVAVRFTAPALALDVPAGTLRLPSWQGQFGPAQLGGEFAGPIGARTVVNARLQLRTDSLRELLRATGIAAPATADAGVLGHFELAATVLHATDATRIDPLSARLDDTQLQGSASLAPRPHGLLRFELEGDRIDLDRYLEPDDVQGKPLRLPLDELKALRVAGRLRLQEARTAGAVLQGVTLELTSAAAAP